MDDTFTIGQTIQVKGVTLQVTRITFDQLHTGAVATICASDMESLFRTNADEAAKRLLIDEQTRMTQAVRKKMEEE